MWQAIACVKCMFMIFIMRLTHIRKSDLNLLLGLSILLEERSVSRAAERFHLSQPAMSRVLQRLRETFEDELLVRTKDGYEVTARARLIQQELEDILPRIEALLRGGQFDPAIAEDTFRLSCTDYATVVLGPALSAHVFREAPGISIEITGWHDQAFEDCIRGRLDLVLWVSEVPGPLVSQPLFEEDFVCVISADHEIADTGLDLETYMSLPHVIVDVLKGRQTLVEDRVAELGLERLPGLRVPYFAAAVNAVPRTNLVATVPRRVAQLYAAGGDIRIMEAPIELPTFAYVMGWHPRSTDDPAHRWLRDAIAAASEDLSS